MPAVSVAGSVGALGAARPQRLAWPDVARGISILGVVMLHVSLAVPEGLVTWLARLNAIIDPMRLPLFFVVSGYFSTKVFRMTFAELAARRLWFFIVPYVIWSAVELWSNSYLYHKVFGDPIRTGREVAEIIALGHSMGWFLHALVLYNVFLWCVRRLPAWAAISLSFLPLFFFGFEEAYFAIGKAGMFLPIFVAGAFLRDHITDFAAAIDSVRRPTMSTFWVFAATIGAYVAGHSIRSAWDGRTTLDPVVRWVLPGVDFIGRNELLLFVRLAEQALELPLAIAAAVLIAHIPYVSGALRFIGSHTLPIYLGHPIALSLGFGLVQAHFNWPISLHGEWPLASTNFWMLACFGWAAVGALALWALGKVPVLGWTVKPPSIERFLVRRR
ncbi:acyltransferase family protein [uncultured Corynebacterium sp.]|uniref:acyltransferase family protein n=1 Tax=uncultured Corynebacterium sp. TaxID=159447 RepID=UPI0025FAF9D0|nr:acyltransferase family protein [uncultured Corynebacterium sp.]